ncbi:MAG: glutamate synthase-related protein [Bacillota bacterium]
MAYPIDPAAREEHDSCALVAVVTRDGRPSRRTVHEAIDALCLMSHRSGLVGEDGDGCGVQTDLPRALWAQRLAAAGWPERYATSLRFAVAHMVAPRQCGAALLDDVTSFLRSCGCRVLWAGEAPADPLALGPGARAEGVVFWQVAVHGPGRGDSLRQRLLALQQQVEERFPVHVASFSPDTVVYKVRGTPSVLQRYFQDLSDPAFASRAVLGHNRYSTNTSTVLPRVQPFGVLGHNGEINTIERLRAEARLLGVSLVEGGSDSQDLNRVLEFFLHHLGLSLFEAMEVLFPPIINEIKHYPEDLQDLYMGLRQSWGPFAQGPAAIMARANEECVFSVDALGLRPLWWLETEETWVFSSEQGVVAPERLESEARPLAPGEKMGLRLTPGGPTHLFRYEAMQQEVARRFGLRQPARSGLRRFLSGGVPAPGDPSLSLAPPTAGGPTLRTSSPAAKSSEPHARAAAATRPEHVAALTLPSEPLVAPPAAEPLAAGLPLSWLAACGWDVEDVKMARHMAQAGAEPIGSLGYDGPLAALARHRHNLADYFKETVAVVTNPAIDREREVEHFSTRVVVGRRPPLCGPDLAPLGRVELRQPLLLGGGPLLPWNAQRALAARLGSACLEDLTAYFSEVGGPTAVATLSLAMGPEGLSPSLDALCQTALTAVREGAVLLLLDDGPALEAGLPVVDPHLALSAVDLALRDAAGPRGQSLRRQVGVVLRSAALRNLHDLALALGLGAEALNPYALWSQVTQEPDAAGREAALERLALGLQKGLEKVLSTLGIHELRGYTRLFSSVGLHAEVASYLRTPNFFGRLGAGRDLAWWEADARDRAEVVRGERGAHLARTPRYTPLVWRLAAEVAGGQRPYADYQARVAELEAEGPVALRHLLDLRQPQACRGGGDAGTAAAPAGVDALSGTHVTGGVDTAAGHHSWPFFISAMSFGSQGETSFRAYLEAARRLNILCINGEGGELPDLLGLYTQHRGQQVASGRFGVNSLLLNSADVLEIKIGQGAKPGEGGHLPGSKVTAKVAAARHAVPGADLISPSNNHDLYSIEDLAQLVTELKTANPRARVSVKVPVVPGIGVIAVGIAKAGADIISLSGYDGGTGAARLHALRHAGLPVEIGVMLAHESLTESGLRPLVEIWADGGMKSAADVVKMLCLGADRVGFATLAMMAIGCTACRGCHLDTCHVGIATQMESWEEAQRKGLKRFEPRVLETAVENLQRLFEAMGREVAALTAGLGLSRTRDLVGRRDLLRQARGLEQVDLSRLLEPVPAAAGAPAEGGRPRAASAPSVVGDLADLRVGPSHRALGTALSGDLARRRLRDPAAPDQAAPASAAALDLAAAARAAAATAPGESGEPLVLLRSVPGNGLAAFSLDGLDLRLTGGAQDGLAKGSRGGRVAVLKYRNRKGRWLGGSVGKSFAYGAQEGLFMVQGDADARAGIRLSGADVVIGGEPAGFVGERGNLALRANVKGFAFEYMTSGRAVVLGDIGPWACSGMTGGVVYCLLRPELGLDEVALQNRLAKGARVQIRALGPQGRKDVAELLEPYAQALESSGQRDAALRVRRLLTEPQRFRAIVPAGSQLDEDISTE